jgi:hypothetical protein
METPRKFTENSNKSRVSVAYTYNPTYLGGQAGQTVHEIPMSKTRIKWIEGGLKWLSTYFTSTNPKFKPQSHQKRKSSSKITMLYSFLPGKNNVFGEKSHT